MQIVTATSLGIGIILGIVWGYADHAKPSTVEENQWIDQIGYAACLISGAGGIMLFSVYGPWIGIIVWFLVMAFSFGIGRTIALKKNSRIP